MDWLHALILGIVQGITEFLPISSSGHLILLPRFLGWPDQGLSFDVAVNTGSLVALVAYFRKDVARLLIAFVKTLRPGGWNLDSGDGRLAWWLGIGTIPIGLAGLAFKDLVGTVARNPLIIATTAIFFGLLLCVADQKGQRLRTLKDTGFKEALVIGCAQALALIPGTSRSGVTMTAGLFLNLDRESSARFSFLLAIPVSVLAGMLEIIEWIRQTPAPEEWLPLAVGFISSGITAFMVIHWLLLWIRSRSLTIFVIYRLLLGITLLLVF
ncbi:MAG: undecaprenyl-diphosphate phosphatase [Magnetococcales bacterium]|nr:undecaprenyl-diphosphate phosphatase [Magnetococcales bacterium]